MINWYTLQSNYHAIIIFCSSHPKQIKPIINYYLCNIREILRDADGPFLLFCSRFPCPRAARPRVTSRRPPRDLQRRRCSKQSCDWDEVCGELSRMCVCECNNKPAAPQGYYPRQSPLNIHQTPLLSTHRSAHTYTQMIIIYNNAPLIKESSLSPCRAAEFCWNNQSADAFRVGLAFLPVSAHRLLW